MKGNTQDKGVILPTFAFNQSYRHATNTKHFTLPPLSGLGIFVLYLINASHVKPLNLQFRALENTSEA